MTRINVVPVRELHDKHLLAEYRELPRVFGAARKWLDRGGKPEDLPQTYRLGKGHVLFFYGRLLYCFERQCALYEECKRRGFNVKHEPGVDLVEGLPHYVMYDYRPTPEALRINRQRIDERLQSMGVHSSD